VLRINVWPVGDCLFGAPSKSAPGARAPLAPPKGRPWLRASEWNQVPRCIVTFALHQLSASQFFTQWLWIVFKDILKLSVIEIYISLSYSWLGRHIKKFQWAVFFSQRVKRPWRKAEHSPPFNTTVKNECSYTTTPCSFMASTTTLPLLYGQIHLIFRCRICHSWYMRIAFCLKYGRKLLWGWV
jgi:hypothetical protein